MHQQRISGAHLAPTLSVAVTTALFAATAAASATNWISQSDQTFGNTANWDNGLPSTSLLAAFPGGPLIQRTVDLSGTTARITAGIEFPSAPGVGGFTFTTSTNNSLGFQSRAGGTVNGVLNLDDDTQTFGVAFKLFTASGGSGSGASQTFNASAGPLVFSGNNPVNATVDNSGGLLTVDGAFDTTIGSAGATRGDLIGTGGLTKNGTGTLTLGGTLANTYGAVTTINNGTLKLNKPAGTNAIAGFVTLGSAPGSGALQLLASNQIIDTASITLSGGTFNANGQSETVAALTLTDNSTIDLGAGSTTSVVQFADSSAATWTAGKTLTILDWSGLPTGGGTEQIRFDSSNGALTPDQLAEIRFVNPAGLPLGTYGAAFSLVNPGEIVASPVPEPAACGLLATAVAAAATKRRRRA